MTPPHPASYEGKKEQGYQVWSGNTKEENVQPKKQGFPASALLTRGLENSLWQELFCAL